MRLPKTFSAVWQSSGPASLRAVCARDIKTKPTEKTGGGNAAVRANHIRSIAPFSGAYASDKNGGMVRPVRNILEFCGVSDFNGVLRHKREPVRTARIDVQFIVNFVPLQRTREQERVLHGHDGVRDRGPR